MTFNAEYKKLVSLILLEGDWILGRNGVTMQIPSYSFTVPDMKEHHKLTIRKMFYGGVLGEFKTLIDPYPLTNVKKFENNGCNYWKEWAGPHGELNLDYANMLHPQLEDVIEQIKNNPSSRRHRIELWNHNNLKELSLPCCWHGLTFTVQESTLHLTWIQRSVDTAVGLPSDVYLAYLFMEHIAGLTGLEIGSCMFALSNVHIYEEHIPGLQKLLATIEEDYGKLIQFKLKA